jgi:hypothetical protein
MEPGEDGLSLLRAAQAAAERIAIWQTGIFWLRLDLGVRSEG